MRAAEQFHVFFALHTLQICLARIKSTVTNLSPVCVSLQTNVETYFSAHNNHSSFLYKLG